MKLEEITPLILTYNEEPNLVRCLERLDWAREVVVLDSLSTDATTEIARRFSNVRVEQRPFDDHTSQWNHGVSLVKSLWVLSLDADYIVPSGFHEELADLQPDDETSAFFARFRYCVFGRPLRAALYPPRGVLFRRDCCEYVEDGHTQLLRIVGEAAHLKAEILHDDRKPLSRWLQSQSRYADLEARHLLAAEASQLNRADRIRRWMFAAPVLVFFYTLIGKGLILDGLPGWHYVVQRTLAELMLSLQLLHRRLEDGGPQA